jgi:hypothetical protein
MMEIGQVGFAAQRVLSSDDSSRQRFAGAANDPVLSPAGAAQFGDQVHCSVSIYAEIVLGPGAGNALEGVLQLEIADGGAIDSGSLDVGGQSYALVGQANGRTIRLLVEVENGQLVAFTGTAEQPLDLCTGTIYGQFGGPELANVGSWSGAAMGSS